MKKAYFLFSLLWFVSCIQFTVFAQQKGSSGYKRPDTAKGNPYLIEALMHTIPFNRLYLHDKIDKELKSASSILTSSDFLRLKNDDSSLSHLFINAIKKDLPNDKIMIENMPASGGRDSILAAQEKIRSLTAIYELLKNLNNDDKPDISYYVNLIANMKGIIIANNENKVLEFAKNNPNIYTLENGKKFFDNNPGFKAYIYLYLAKEDNKTIIRRLSEYALDSFAGTIIRNAAKFEPDLIFNYATSTNIPIHNAVRRTNDKLVQTIALIADQAKVPLKAFPFLGVLYNGNKTIAEIDSITENPDLYYHNLILLRIANDSVARKVYMNELDYRGLLYIRKVNELHEAQDAIRFRCIDSLKAIDLYYLIINGQDEIYTSSYLGIFKRLLERMKPLKGNEFLDTLHYDHFRTFIKLCAGYNTFTSFVNTMNDTSRTYLLQRFIGGLQYNITDDLESAVEVADALGSLKDSTLMVQLEKNVKQNYELCYSESNRKGMIIYSLLSRLIEGSRVSGNDEGAKIASDRLRLPLINKVSYQDLVSDSGIVYQQVFFFGDEDGEKSYQSFMNTFKKDSRWKIDTNQYWTTIYSISGKKNVIFANAPLKEPTDEEAQNLLSKYLADSGIHPTIFIHRGHSYHLPKTLSKINSYAKIVILGSCGGYHNLSLVLDRAPDAQLISSKQTGVMAVNEPIISAINNTLLKGNDIDWIPIWNDLETYFLNKPELHDKFEDYIPPYKNLGALFIKAYRKVITLLPK